MNYFFLLFSVLLSINGYSQFDGNTSPNYPELIAYYQKLDAQHKEIELYEMGESDYGLPIYICIINGAQDSLKTFDRAKKETTILINNAIHPGEPDGVNACLLWIENWIKNGKDLKSIPVIAIIPAYNVGGMMNRSSSSRANQEGPEEYGFRGNAQNLDLNRDFIKMDSKNMFTFATIYQALDPDVFVDTHVSNGADYQYVFTLITSLKERNAPSINAITHQHLIPDVKQKLKSKKIELFPYVELVEETPDKGIMAFNDLPRYAMGYASLFNAISFTSETHMLKPFPQRVQATKEFISELIIWMNTNKLQIEKARSEANKWQGKQKYYKYNYALADKADSILFLGYEHTYKKSEVTGLDRLYYDRSKAYQRYVPHYQTYETKDSSYIPRMYAVQSQCEDVIERLKVNGVKYDILQKDTLLHGSYMYVESYESNKKPYEGHFVHSKVKMQEDAKSIIYLKKGDILISTDQVRKTFIVSVLEPEAEDSYFNWNFFDSYLQQKEYFSAYVFEDKAVELLKNDPELKQKFEEKKKNDPKFSTDANAQLYFIYKNSPYFEPTASRLPVIKLN